MDTIIDKKTLNDFSKVSKLEWLETNGLGGYSSSTIAGHNSRRYHGLLVSAINPPTERMVLLSKLEESVYLNDGRKIELFTNQFPGSVSPTGYQFLSKFEKKIFPKFTFSFEDYEIEKSIISIHNEDTIVITYNVKSAKKEFYMDLRPFISFRDYHSLAHTNDTLKWDYLYENNQLCLQPYENLPELFIHVPNSKFTYFPGWYHNFEYIEELERGMDFKEDLFSHGHFSIKLSAGMQVNIIVSTKNTKERDVSLLIKNEITRRNNLLTNLPKRSPIIDTLCLAADQFIVKRSNNLRTIIAGYPWFSDWGRDTMISLPGICLVTGRFDEARKILQAFAQVVNNGMIPNRFPDKGDEPEYNTVDATLWYFIAAYKYHTYTNDTSFIKEYLLPVLRDIIKWHEKGTRYHIKELSDGLIFAGEEGVQLTWMDAKVGDWVVTPRIGRPVEINALWYNALRIMEYFENLLNNIDEKNYFSTKSAKTLESFKTLFWNQEQEYLYDCVGDYVNDLALRPNQIFALSLPYPLLETEQANLILEKIENNLLTPYGLRSLNPENPFYRSHYFGNQWSRDGSYHQGTVWSWLLGPFYSAKIRFQGEKGKNDVKNHLNYFSKHLKEGGVGTVSEIFDGNEPYKPNGCIAQAWGVAEILRVYIEDLD